MFRTVRIACTTLIAVAITLSGCGSSDNAADHNSADVAFAQGMVPHHVGALDMVRLAPAQADSAEVKQLALQIEKAQSPEIDLMNGWLEDWGKPNTAENGAHDHGGGEAEGMMTAEQTAQLKSARGAAFDKFFLEQMIEHHQGAITMSQTEVEDGEFEAAKALAQTIITSQQAEIDQMKALLTKLA